ncbi:hypothetical protein Acy02nite_66010 [Actinoplanes cyaneus]|uniref:Uncharacterized protein n=1 Tax=Actinoplanes cyaneus TaxID=52696 RepID=A0A919M3W4_9ACTN|nr:hypothetical protein Acy02nite_66010 [Actinoplanes cyaneus]
MTRRAQRPVGRVGRERRGRRHQHSKTQYDAAHSGQRAFHAMKIIDRIDGREDARETTGKDGATHLIGRTDLASAAS